MAVPLASSSHECKGFRGPIGGEQICTHINDFLLVPLQVPEEGGCVLVLCRVTTAGDRSAQ